MRYSPASTRALMSAIERSVAARTRAIPFAETSPDVTLTAFVKSLASSSEFAGRLASDCMRSGVPVSRCLPVFLSFRLIPARYALHPCSASQSAGARAATVDLPMSVWSFVTR